MSDMEWRHNPEKYPFETLTQFQKSVVNHDHLIMRYKECINDEYVNRKYWFIKRIMEEKLAETGKLRDEFLGYIEQGYKSWSEVPFCAKIDASVIATVESKDNGDK